MTQMKQKKCWILPKDPIIRFSCPKRQKPLAMVHQEVSPSGYPVHGRILKTTGINGLRRSSPVVSWIKTLDSRGCDVLHSRYLIRLARMG